MKHMQMFRHRRGAGRVADCTHGRDAPTVGRSDENDRLETTSSFAPVISSRVVSNTWGTI
ncbi:MAG: hypothetical protein HC933_19795 [Pleurocapsa sp. SU_196_0]|nr:hypothetical protein [Pleurocapsa sp. SU_196_0]